MRIEGRNISIIIAMASTKVKVKLTNSLTQPTHRRRKWENVTHSKRGEKVEVLMAR